MKSLFNKLCTNELSPGAYNQLHANIVHEFCPRFIGEGGKVLYIGDTASSRNVR
ncbi:TPA: BsuBI/PstI family type II restriction endonuclease [Photobacterium damselae]